VFRLDNACWCNATALIAGSPEDRLAVPTLGRAIACQTPDDGGARARRVSTVREITQRSVVHSPKRWPHRWLARRTDLKGFAAAVRTPVDNDSVMALDRTLGTVARAW
jgi:hypothetical protein